MNKILLLIALTILLKPIFPVIDYLVNYHNISTVLCENKKNPKLKCCGKCHLKKELASASEGEKPTTPHKKTQSKSDNEVLFLQNSKTVLPKQLYTKTSYAIRDFYTTFYCLSVNCSLFRPPILA